MIELKSMLEGSAHCDATMAIAKRYQNGGSIEQDGLDLIAKEKPEWADREDAKEISESIAVQNVYKIAFEERMAKGK